MATRARTITSLCAEDKHDKCPGGVTKWHAEPGDTVIDSGPVVASDDLGVVVACECDCGHPHLNPGCTCGGSGVCTACVLADGHHEAV